MLTGSSSLPGPPLFWHVHSLQPQPEVVAQAASVLRRGGVIVYPTETFYGLGGDPLQPAAVERVFRIKVRGWDKALPLIAADEAAARRVVRMWPAEAEKLARAFWPGPLTLILPCTAQLPPMLHAGTERIAVRVSPHPVARALAEAAGGLLISTSANAAGQPPHRSPDSMPAELLARVDGILHAGETLGGLPSTLVDLSEGDPRLVREGAVAWEEVLRAISAGR